MISRAATLTAECGATGDPDGREGTQRAILQFSPSIMAVALIGLGALLRARQYLFDRSLWLDEALVTLNILQRSYRQLLGPLDYNQATPYGFLVLEKVAVQAFGDAEYVLRLVPLMAGFGTLILAHRVFARCLDTGAALLATALVALSPQLIYYSSEVKQYSTDVFIALGIIISALGFQARLPPRLTSTVTFCLVGAVAIWMSHAAVFVLVGVIVTLGIAGLRNRDGSARRLRVPSLVWMASFAACFLLSLRHSAGDKYLYQYWRSAFAPFPPASLTDLAWYAKALVEALEFVAGIGPPWLAALLFAIGCVRVVTHCTPGRMLLLLPAMAALFASALGLYPFAGRLLLFLAPAFVAFVADGAEALGRRIHLRWGTLVLGIVLVVPPARTSLQQFFAPVESQSIKAVLEHLQANRRHGDVVYVHSLAAFPIRYYGTRYGLRPDDYTVGGYPLAGPRNFAREFSPFSGARRVWVLFASRFNDAGIDEQAFTLGRLDRVAIPLGCFRRGHASACLYDLGSAKITDVRVP